MKTLLMGMGLLLLAASAQADVKFCYTAHAQYVDNNIGEDNWLSDTQRSLKGAYVTVRRDGPSGALLFNGYLGDALGTNDPGAGCIPNVVTTNNNDTYWVRLTSSGAQVNGNSVSAIFYSGSAANIDYTYVHTGGAGTFNIPISDTVRENQLWNIFVAAAHSIYRHGGGLSGKQFLIQYTDDGTRNPNLYNGTTIYINTDAWNRKFMISYFIGLRLAHLAVGSEMYARSASGSSVTCPAGPAGATHSMGSRENQALAIQEGFAHFYAADVWNNDDFDDCKLGYFQDEFGTGAPTIDCESSDANYPRPYMETVCGTPWDGRGTTVDWMRTFWDLHTDGADEIPFNDILAWLRSADYWSDQNGYAELEEEAAQIGGTFYTRWTAAANTNGVDWP
jgi:hypothetical protein